MPETQISLHNLPLDDLEGVLLSCLLDAGFQLDLAAAAAKQMAADPDLLEAVRSAAN